MTVPAITLDPFQVEANAAVDEGSAVLVAAPTGAGKTVVADHAVDRALAQGLRAFYTTPIKALSNQKHADLRARLGADRVGLITGDTTIAPDAPVVVMTTEVLRNMLYSRSGAVEGLGVVVLDEVHYLQDRYRGPVWEEVIIHLPRSVQIVALSATVSNVDELAAWMDAVRGATVAVVEHRRPVELVNLYAAHDRTTRKLVVVPVVVDGEPNPFGARLDPDPAAARRDRRDRRRRRYATPRRVEVVHHLDDEDLLPAIVFVFSRRGCDDAARTLHESGTLLTEPEERGRIREIVAAHTAGLSDADLDVLGFHRWRAGLEAGIAAHHAGMVPPFREAVEACFVAGLVKVVFATETLALGINMPARSVVIESLSKFTGEQHERLTPGQYTQLTGRAGRRGLDDEGRALVLWSPFVRFQEVADLVLSRQFELRSAFRPTSNMVANLVRRHDEEEARRLISLSFAQHQADAGVVRLRARREARSRTLARLDAEASCDRGDVAEYLRLLRSDEEERHRARPASRDVLQSLARLRPGDVVELHERPVAVVSVGWRGPERARLHFVDAEGNARAVASGDVEEVLHRLGTVDVPEPYAPQNPRFRRELGENLARVRALRRGRRRRHARPAAAPDHPVADCPDLADHLRAARQAARVRSELAELDGRLAGAGGSLEADLDRVLDVLGRRGMVDGWSLTDRGRVLARIFHECDLLVADGLTAGLLDDLDPPALAAAASLFTYEHRSKEPPPPPWYPSRALRDRVEDILDRADAVRHDEQAVGLPATRELEPAFAPAAHAWAAGHDLEDVLPTVDMTPGDFVRNVRQLIDLLRQIGDAAPVAGTARAARSASEALRRGVVEASTPTTPTPIDPPDGDDPE